MTSHVAHASFTANNLDRQPHEVDVHRLTTVEAIIQIKNSLRMAMIQSASELRIICGKGNHSKDKVAVLKPAIIKEMKECVIFRLSFLHLPKLTDLQPAHRCRARYQERWRTGHQTTQYLMNFTPLLGFAVCTPLCVFSTRYPHHCTMHQLLCYICNLYPGLSNSTLHPTQSCRVIVKI